MRGVRMFIQNARFASAACSFYLCTVPAHYAILNRNLFLLFLVRFFLLCVVVVFFGSFPLLYYSFAANPNIRVGGVGFFPPSRRALSTIQTSNTSTTVGFPTRSKSDTLQYFCSLNLNPCNSFTKIRGSQNAAPRPPTALCQTYPLPSPNRCPLRNRRACHALPTLCLPRWPSGPPRVEVQSAWQVQDLGPLRALSPFF